MWIERITPMVMTILTVKLNAKYHDKYPDGINVTNKNQNMTAADLPCVYVQELSMMELARELEPGEYSAVQSDLQIEVYSNMSQTEAKQIANAVTDIMSDYGYGAMSLPYPMNGNGIYRTVSRFRRTVGSDDVNKIFNS